MRSLPLAVSILAGTFALLVDGPARANIQSPPEEACAGKKVADACQLPSGEAGSCKADKCNQLDYSQGSPPKSVEVDCVVCIAGAGQPPGPGPTAVGSGDEGGGADTSVSDPAPADTTATPAADPTPEPPSSESRCSVSGDTPGFGVAMLWLAALALRKRRRAEDSRWRARLG